MGLPTEAGHLWLDTVLQEGSNGYLALLTADVTPSSTGSTVTEPAGGNYSRVLVVRDATNWPNAAGGQAANGTDIQFPIASAAWGTCTHWAYLTASSGGTIIVTGRLIKALAVVAGKAPLLEAGRAVVYAPFQVAA